MRPGFLIRLLTPSACGVGTVRLRQLRLRPAQPRWRRLRVLPTSPLYSSDNPLSRGRRFRFRSHDFAVRRSPSAASSSTLSRQSGPCCSSTKWSSVWQPTSACFNVSSAISTRGSKCCGRSRAPFDLRFFDTFHLLKSSMVSADHASSDSAKMSNRNPCSSQAGAFSVFSVQVVRPGRAGCSRGASSFHAARASTF